MSIYNVKKDKRSLPPERVVDMPGTFEELKVTEALQHLAQGRSRKYKVITYVNGDFAGDLHWIEGIGFTTRNCFKQSADDALATSAMWWDIACAMQLRPI